MANIFASVLAALAKNAGSAKAVGATVRVGEHIVKGGVATVSIKGGAPLAFTDAAIRATMGSVGVQSTFRVKGHNDDGDAVAVAYRHEGAGAVATLGAVRTAIGKAEQQLRKQLSGRGGADAAEPDGSGAGEPAMNGQAK